MDLASRMSFWLMALIFLPHMANAETNICLSLNPNQEPEMSIEACTEFLKVDSMSISERAGALENRGIALRELGRLDESIRDLGASVALLDNTASMRMLAWTYREAGRHAEAEQLYTRVLERDGHPQGWLSRCVVRQDMENYVEALPDCMEALGQDSEDLDALFFTARAYSFLDRPKDALPLTEAAMSLSPSDPRHLVEHVWALHQLGRTSHARRLADEGLSQFPENLDLLSFLSTTR